MNCKAHLNLGSPRRSQVQRMWIGHRERSLSRKEETKHCEKGKRSEGFNAGEGKYSGNLILFVDNW